MAFLDVLSARGLGRAVRRAKTRAQRLWDLSRTEALITARQQGVLRAPGEGRLSLRYLGRPRLQDELRFFFANGQTGRESHAVGGGHLFWFWRQMGVSEGEDVVAIDALDGLFAPPADTMIYYPYLRAVLPIASTFTEQLQRMASKSQRRRLSRIAEDGYSFEETDAMRDFELFYRDMYTPYAGERHKGDAHVFSREEMAAVFRRQGHLLLIKKDGEPVAGGLFYRSLTDRKSLFYWRNGIARAAALDAPLLGERTAALDAAAIQFAIAKGCENLDFGLVKAFLFDGLLVHKRRIGCDFRLPEQPLCFYLRMRPERRAELARALPLITVGADGFEGVAALPSTGDKDVREFFLRLRDTAFTSLRRVTLLHAAAHSREDLAALAAPLEKELGLTIVFAPAAPAHEVGVETAPLRAADWVAQAGI